MNRTLYEMRFDFADLAALCLQRWRAESAASDLHIGETGKVAAVLGVSRVNVQRWRKCGLDHWAADRMAIALGLHPCEIWPEWLYLDDLDEVA